MSDAARAPVALDPDVQPTWDGNGVPFCDRERCPSYDGKRCRAIGFRPESICEPAVIEMAAALQKEIT